MREGLFDLAGTVAIVTGGNGGIGEGIACGLAAAGSNIVIAARDVAKGRDVARGIEDHYGVKALCLELDVRDPESIERLVADAIRHFGCIDILVNNAAILKRKSPQDFTIEEWEDIISTNLRGVFLCSQAVYPFMKGRGGKIINIGSLVSIVGSARNAVYAASKGGVLQLTRSLAVAWGPDNIQVNAILPGWISTAMNVRARKDFQDTDMDKHVLARTPAGRWGTAEDCVGPAVFLASHASDFVTGEFLIVDGGYAQTLLMITEQ